MGPGAMNLPDGFVLDQSSAAASPELPDGFVLDQPKAGSAVSNALRPIMSYPEAYNEARGESQQQLARGAGQISSALRGEDIMGYPVDRGWEAAKGVGNTALGAIGFVASPINAGLRTVIGKPIEDTTGLPKEYTEFAASLALPGMGMTKINSLTKAAPAALKPGQEVANAGARLGVSVPRAVATDSTGIQRTAATVRNIPGAGDPIIRATEKTIGQLADKANDVAASYGGGTVIGGGEAAKSAINTYITGTTAERSRKLYDTVDNLVNNSVRVPLQITSGVAREIMTRRANAALGEDSKALGLVIEAINRPQGLNYQGIKDLRTYIGEFVEKGILPEGMSQGELKRIYGALTDDYRITTSIAGGQKAVDALKRADRYYRLISERREQLAKIVGATGDAPAEQVFDRILAKAGGTSRADIESLTKARKAIGAEDWNEFVSGVVTQMGRNPTTRGAPEALQTIDFSPERFLTAYSKLSAPGRSLLFNSGGRADLAAQLRDIAAISTRFKELQKFSNPSGTGQTLAGAGLGAGAFADPLTTITAVIGGRAVAMMLSRPATAASAAQFSRKYELALRHPSPATVAGLTLASRNLANTLKDAGVATSAQDFLKTIQGPMKAPANNEQPEPERVINR